MLAIPVEAILRTTKSPGSTIKVEVDQEGEGCATDVNDNEGEIETHKEVVFDAERLIRSLDGTSVPQMDGVISNVDLHVKVLLVLPDVSESTDVHGTR